MIPFVRDLLHVVLVFLLSGWSVKAEVQRIEISSRADVLNGKAFGTAGPYEKLIGKVYFTVNPNHPGNKRIADLALAPRNNQGLIEFSADLFILKPKAMKNGNQALLMEISNRGGKGMVRFFNRAPSSLNPSSAEEFGDGFLLNQGYTLVWVGWQTDVPRGNNTLRLTAPVATEHGKSISGLVRSDFVFPVVTYQTTLGHRGQNAQPVLDLRSSENVLTVRESVTGKRNVVSREEWAFGRIVNGAIVPDSTWICMRKGFEPGKLYEVVYRTKDPVVIGLGLAAVRDLISYFKHQPEALVNVRYALGFGISQSGRFLRHFLYDGFNADLQGRIVFDGLDAHVAGAGRGSFNHRFGEASRDGSPFYTHFYPTDIFPFTDTAQKDPVTGIRDGLLTHAASPATLPKIFYTNSSYEYWGRAASLIHTSIDGKSDMPLMKNVRIYYFAGGQHGPSGFPPGIPSTQNKPIAQQHVSPNDYTWSMRALLFALDQWVRAGMEPPPSQYPLISNGTLVRPAKVRFPKIPGVNFPRTFHGAYRVDYGSEWQSRRIISNEPPLIGKSFPVMVPQVDKDGIDLGGIRMPEVAVPLATYTGWNPRHPGTGAPDQLVDFLGSFIPFSRTKSERLKRQDPRPSIEERYHNEAQYLQLIDRSINDLVHQRFLLPGDGPAVRERARQYWNYGITK